MSRCQARHTLLILSGGQYGHLKIVLEKNDESKIFTLLCPYQKLTNQEMYMQYTSDTFACVCPIVFKTEIITEQVHWG